MKYQYLLFDWDGTLHNTLPAWIKAIEKTLKVHNTHVPRNEVVGWLVPGITENINRYLAIDPEVFKSQVLATNEIRQLHEAALHDKIFDHLTTIATLNIPTALVTSSDRAIVEAALKHHKLHDYFNVVVSGNDIKNRKPHPEPIYKALEQLGAVAAESLMVGDSAADILAAQAAGVSTALHYPGVHQEYYKTADIEALSPDYILRDFAELLDLV